LNWLNEVLPLDAFDGWGPCLIQRRIKNQLAGDLISFDEAVGFGGGAEGHGAMIDCADFTRAGRIERFLNIRRIGPGSAEDALAAQVESC
jgi:hypothetical protein